MLVVPSESKFLNVWFFNCAVEAAGGKALPCVVNVREEHQIINAVEKAVKTFGGMLRCGGDDNMQIVHTWKEQPASLMSFLSLNANAKWLVLKPGIDILVNNASAISLTGTLETETKKVNLMMDVNVRGTYLT